MGSEMCIRDRYRTGGWEVIKGFEFEKHTERLSEESQRLLVAPQCPEGTMDLILEGSQLALQIHESVGHAYVTWVC